MFHPCSYPENNFPKCSLSDLPSWVTGDLAEFKFYTGYKRDLQRSPTGQRDQKKEKWRERDQVTALIPAGEVDSRELLRLEPEFNETFQNVEKSQ